MEPFYHTNLRQGAKVYINPNFRGPQPISTSINSTNVMHFNTAFTVHRSSASNTHKKIFVNPNFVHPSAASVLSGVTPVSNVPSSNLITIKEPSISTLTNSRYSLIRKPTQSTVSTSQASTSQAASTSPAVQIRKSKYSLVRQQVNPTPILGNKLMGTVSINKYKCVKLNYIKINLNTKPRETVHASLPKSNITFPSSKINKFKYVKRKSLNVSSSLILNKKCKFRGKIIAKNLLPTKSRNDSFKPQATCKSLKKNNIPCPLFRKYGKCLRKDRGTCDYLHDKKHVAICRSFLKGLCFKSDCLLSHELSTKKMPTCHFYLNGNCTKDNCPYLHVKLSDSAKICSDFAKGYCEKGEQCLKRHVYTANSKPIKKTSTKVVINPEINIKKEAPVPNQDEGEEQEIQSRYYGKTANDTETYSLKPTRCKIGTLPSFIKLT